MFSGYLWRSFFLFSSQSQFTYEARRLLQVCPVTNDTLVSPILDNMVLFIVLFVKSVMNDVYYIIIYVSYQIDPAETAVTRFWLLEPMDMVCTLHPSLNRRNPILFRSELVMQATYQHVMALTESMLTYLFVLILECLFATTNIILSLQRSPRCSQ